eukprot:3307071-Pyramimonas_sp.AAC.1
MWKGLSATNRRPRDDLFDHGAGDYDFKIPCDRDAILSAGVEAGFSEVDPNLLREASWCTVAARPFAARQPIHLLEGASLLHGVRRAARNIKCHSHRLVFL